MNYFENEQKLYFAKLDEKAIIPTKNDEDAGYDVYGCFDDDFIIESLQTRLVPTKLACAMSPKYYIQIEERSSSGSKGIKKSAGVVDSGYRGEIKVAITNATNKTLIFSNKTAKELANSLNLNEEDLLVYPQSKAIAQFVVHEVPRMQTCVISYEELMKIPSKRNTGGFGSTNK